MVHFRQYTEIVYFCKNEDRLVYSLQEQEHVDF